MAVSRWVEAVPACVQRAAGTGPRAAGAPGHCLVRPDRLLTRDC